LPQANRHDFRPPLFGNSRFIRSLYLICLLALFRCRAPVLIALLAIAWPRQLWTRTARDSGEGASVSETVADLAATPHPAYPFEARRDYLQGQGLYLVRFDPDTGRARDAIVIRSSGHAILDEAAINSLRRWRIRPHTLKAVKVPFNFELNGATAAAMRAAGGNVLYAPAPHFPLSARWEHVQGSGKFELLIDRRSGAVTDVKVLETMRDVRLDAAAIEAFRRWRFKPNTIQKLIVPINFTVGYG
jgi:TonB family protein